MELTHTVVMPLYDGTPYKWFGDAPLVDRAFGRLEDARDLHRLVLVARDTNAAQEVADGAELDMPIEVIQLPSKKPTLLGLLRWFATQHKKTRKPQILVGLNPLFPFLDRGRTESALYSVRDGKQSAATVTKGLTISNHRTQRTVRPELRLVEACIAVHTDLFKGRCPDGEPLGDCKLMEVDALEAIDTSTSEGLTIAEAVLNHGDV